MRTQDISMKLYDTLRDVPKVWGRFSGGTCGEEATEEVGYTS